MADDRRIQPAGSGGGGGGSSAGGGGVEPGLAKRLLHVLRAVFHMLRRGLCRKRLMMDLHLLLGRGKLAGRALRDLLAHQPHAGGHHHNFGAAAAAASPSALSMYQHNPRDVEFSCDTTPVYDPAVFPFRIGRGRGRGGNYGGLDAATVAAAFEMMNAQAAGTSGAETSGVTGATPSPMLALSLGRCPAGARQLRVTDSPFPVEPEGVDERVDAEADSFIKRFYEQLRLQQSTTPDNCTRRRG